MRLLLLVLASFFLIGAEKEKPSDYYPDLSMTCHEIAKKFCDSEDPWETVYCGAQIERECKKFRKKK